MRKDIQAIHKKITLTKQLFKKTQLVIIFSK